MKEPYHETKWFRVGPTWVMDLTNTYRSISGMDLPDGTDFEVEPDWRTLYGSDGIPSERFQRKA